MNNITTGQDEYGDYNNQCEEIYYYHHDDYGSYPIVPDPDETSPDITVSPVSNTIFEIEQACISTLDEESFDDLHDSMAEYEAKADSTEVVLVSYVDGGDTEALNLEVQSSTPEDALELQNELLQQSPYLSDTVMIDAVNKENVLPPLMLTEVLSANPQSAKSNDIMDAVDQRINPLSDDMLDEINENLNIIGAKETIEANLAHYKLMYHRNFRKYIKQWMNDTLSIHSCDSICQMLAEGNSLSNKYQLAMYHLGTKDTIMAKQIMDSINVNFELSAHESALYQNYNSYMNVINSIYHAGNEVIAVDSAQKAALYILKGKNNLVGAYARNILQFADTLTYNEPIIMPSFLKSYELHKKSDDHGYDNENIKVYPNPSNTYLIIEWNIPSLANAELSIFNLKGKIMDKMQISIGKGYKIVGTRDFPSGIYFCRVSGSNGTNEIVKFVIEH